MLLDKNDQIKILLGEKYNGWKIKLVFQDDSKVEGPAIKNDYEGKNITLFLKNWFHELWIENTEPLSLKSKDGKTELFMRLRSTASVNQKNRLIIVSIWKIKRFLEKTEI